MYKDMPMWECDLGEGVCPKRRALVLVLVGVLRYSGDWGSRPPTLGSV